MTEKQLHKQICDYLHMQYPKVLFNTDMSGIRLTLGQARQAKKLRSDNGYPDIIIYEIGLGMYHALFLEVKKETPYKKDRTLKKNDHLFEQAEMHEKLRYRNYKAEFVWTLDMAKNIIDGYLN